MKLYFKKEFARPAISIKILPMEENEEEIPICKPRCDFVKSQVLLVTGLGKELQEFPVSGDEKKTKDTFGTWKQGVIYGYILNRRSEFVPRFYGWGIAR